ncbi:MAG: ATP-binding protein [Chloroflexaceae bacterium]|nr:ATP-binding protein [Chloroflexaceae bacterium]
MNRFFNTAGPCNPNDHYMLPAAARLPEVTRLIAQKLYFVLHAPRQTGKTTALLTLAQELTAAGTYTAVLVSMEVGAPFEDDPGAAEDAILNAWLGKARAQLPPALQPPPWPTAPAGRRVGVALQTWAMASPRPLVVFLDEIDALRDGALISVLRQLRDGYADRPRAFPWSLALIGLRDVRDYKVASGGSDRLHTTSPFNIKAESLTLRNFTAAEVAALYQQHTDETGQVFTPDATVRAFYLTQGQPWLVNALARQITEVLVPDPATPITPAHVDQAKELLIQRQDTHLDSLVERLREPRVRRIIEPILAGLALENVAPDDLRFVQDLGLCRMDPAGGLVVANPIYQEVIPRVLANAPQASLPIIAPTWLTPDGKLDPAKLLEAFLAFWRQHGQPLLKSAPYHEIAPHLVLMAFLHRVVNAGGTIEREYAISTGRMDLCVRYGEVSLAMELKVWREGETNPLRAGLAQLDAYLAGLGLDTGWLVIFDQREGLPDLAERTTTEPATTPAGRSVVVVRG